MGHLGSVSITLNNTGFWNYPEGKDVTELIFLSRISLVLLSTKRLPQSRLWNPPDQWIFMEIHGLCQGHVLLAAPSPKKELKHL